jgi:hypothetical protein
MPTIDLTDGKRAAATAAIRRPIDQDRFPRPAPRPAPLGPGQARSSRSGGAQATADGQRPPARLLRRLLELGGAARRKPFLEQSPDELGGRTAAAARPHVRAGDRKAGRRGWRGGAPFAYSFSPTMMGGGTAPPRLLPRKAKRQARSPDEPFSSLRAFDLAPCAGRGEHAVILS